MPSLYRTLTLSLGLALSPALALAEPACLPQFPYQEGWMGGDGIYSIELSKDQTLWLFGDSFVRPDLRLLRGGSKMISNSVAISRCHEGRFELNYFWKNKGLAPLAPQALFKDPVAGVKLWPKDGILYQNKLILFLDRVKTQNVDNPLGFDLIGTTVIRIENPFDPPAQWKMNTQVLPNDGKFLLAASTLRVEKELYLYSIITGTPHQLALSKLPLDTLVGDLSQLKDSLHTLTASGWKKGLHPSRAKILLKAASTEMTVRPFNQKYLLTLTSPEFPSAKIISYQAAHPVGPFEDQTVLFEYPEAKSGETNYHSKNFCYAGKEQAQFRRGNTLTLTYACNSFDFSKLIGNLKIYRPMVIRVTQP